MIMILTVVIMTSNPQYTRSLLFNQFLFIAISKSIDGVIIQILIVQAISDIRHHLDVCKKKKIIKKNRYQSCYKKASFS